MIVLDYIKEVKKLSDKKTFKEMLIDVNNKKKSTAAKQLSLIKIQEKDKLLHLKYDNKVMFHTAWNEFFCLCRGLVINYETEEIVLHPFDKFFEMDEYPAVSKNEIIKKYKSKIKHETTEKIDGSLIIARWYNDSLLVVSSNQFDSIHQKMAHEYISKNYIDFMKAKSDFTIMFEMKSSKYRGIIKYDTDECVLIGMRDMRTNHLLFSDEIKQETDGYNVKIYTPRQFTLDELFEELKSNNFSLEGYVLRIDDFMVKLKYEPYKLAHGFSSDPGRNFNIMIKILEMGIQDEIEPLIHDSYKSTYEYMKQFFINKLNEKKKNIEKLYNKIPESDVAGLAKYIETQKYMIPYKADLIYYKTNNKVKFSKNDIQNLRQYAKYFHCLSHIKYAEMNNINVEFVVQKIKSGEIKYINHFQGNDTEIYIINMWQFLKE